MRSSMKTSRIRLLMIFEGTGAYERDHRTTPEVVNISKVSNMTARCWDCGCGVVWRFRGAVAANDDVVFRS